MADDGFTVELEFRTKKARQQVDKFVTDSVRKFKKLKVDLGTTSSSRSAARTGGRGGSASSSGIDRELDLRLRSQTKAIEKAQKDRKKIQQRVVESQKRTADSLVRIDQIKNQRLRDAAIRTRAEIFRIQKSGDIREVMQLQKKNQRLLAISKADAKIRFQQIVKQEAAFAGLSQSRTNALLSQQRFNKGTRKGSRDLSKLNVIVFQTQQAIEDFSFAGLRGAGNNLALMASFIGGPTGIIALLAITTITLGPMIKKWLSAKNAVKDAAKEQKRHNDELQRFHNIQKDVIGLGIKTKNQGKNLLNPRLIAAKEELTILKRTLIERQKEQKILENIRKNKEKFFGLGLQIGSLPRGTQGQLLIDADKIRLRKMVEEQSRAREELNRLIDPSNLPVEIGRQIDPESSLLTRLDVIKQIGKISEKNFNDLKSSIVSENDRIKKLTEEIKKREKILTLNENAQKFLEGRLSNETKLSLITGSRIEKLKAERNIRASQFEDETNALLTEKAKGIETEKQFEALIRFSQQRFEVFRKGVKPFDDEIVRLEKEKKAQQEILRLQERQSREAERQIEAEKKKLKTLRERIAATKEDTRLSVLRSGDRFAASVFGTRRGNVARFARSAGERRIERTTSGLQKRGITQEQISRIESRMRARLDQQIQSRDRAMLERRGAFLSKAAGAAGAGGDIGRQRSLLQDLQQLQLGFAGKTGSPALAQKALAAAANTQKLLEQTFKAQQQIDQKKLEKEVKASESQIQASRMQMRAANAQLQAAGIKPPGALNKNAPGAGAPLLPGPGLKKTNVKFQSGGPVTGPGGIDNVPSMLTAGEVVLNEQQQRRMEQLTGAHRGNVFKAMGVPGFAGGGLAGPLGRFRNVGGATSFEGNFLPEQIPMLIAAANQRASSARISAINQMQYFKQKIRVLGGSKRELTQLLDPARSDQIKQSVLRSIFGRQGFTQIGRPRSENAFLKDVFGELKFIMRNIAAQPRVDPFLPFAGGGKVPFSPSIARGFNSGGVAQSVSNTTNSQMFSGPISIDAGSGDSGDIFRALQINEMNQNIRRGV